MSKMK